MTWSVGNHHVVVPGPGSSPGQALVPGIHDLNRVPRKPWMAGTKPGHDRNGTYPL